MKDNSKVFLQWRDKSCAEGFSTGVSLHSHTMHSREVVTFLPRFASKAPGGAAIFRHIEKQHRRSVGEELDYKRAFWTPPLSAHEAWRVEKDQIESKLGLNSFVSITDHDSMEANARLQLVEEAWGAPFSVEWTVPYSNAVFHIGIHNIPSHRAQQMMADFAEYTASARENGNRANPRDERLSELLAAAHEIPDVLIVLNHPLSDEGRIGNPIHEEHLATFIKKFGRFLHALELNAMQPWKDNIQVAEIAKRLGYPVISGGDRHACEPNANVNLTNAASFSEFVSEVREGGVSNVLFMPQSRESLTFRYMESIWHILRDYPERPDRVRWNERVFYIGDDGQARSIAMLSPNNRIAKTFSGFVHLFGFIVGPHMRPAWKLALPKEEVAL